MGFKSWASENGVLLGFKITLVSLLIIVGLAAIAYFSVPYGPGVAILILFSSISSSHFYFALALFLTALARPDKKEHVWRTIIMCVISLWIANGAVFPLTYLLNHLEGARGANKGFAYAYIYTFVIGAIVFLFFYISNRQKRTLKIPEMPDQTSQTPPPIIPSS